MQRQAEAFLSAPRSLADISATLVVLPLLALAGIALSAAGPIVVTRSSLLEA